MPFPTRHCPVPSSHANGQHGHGAHRPHTTCQKMLGSRAHRPHGPGLAGVANCERVVATPPSKPRVPHRPVPSKTVAGGTVTNVWPRGLEPASQEEQQIGSGTMKECCGRWDWPRAIGRCGSGRGADGMRGLPLAIGCPRASRQAAKATTPVALSSQHTRARLQVQTGSALLATPISALHTTGRFIRTGFKT